MVAFFVRRVADNYCGNKVGKWQWETEQCDQASCFNLFKWSVVVSENICGDWMQFLCQMLFITDLIQFTPNTSGSQPLDRGHINREMWLWSLKHKKRGYRGGGMNCRMGQSWVRFWNWMIHIQSHSQILLIHNSFNFVWYFKLFNLLFVSTNHLSQPSSRHCKSEDSSAIPVALPPTWLIGHLVLLTVH